MKQAELKGSSQTPLQEGRSLPVMEQFYTIQGEGFHTGKAAYFLRVGGCDVGCHWCDVKESWDSSIHPLTDVCSVVANAKQYPARTVVITGGEPLMFNMDFVTSEFRKHGFHVHVETSGAHPTSGQFDWVCLSPKKNSPPLTDYYQLANELKMIVHNRHDFEWANQHAAKVRKDCKLFLQPEWSKRNEMMPLIIEHVMNFPEWNISLQSHKYMNIP